MSVTDARVSDVAEATSAAVDAADDGPAAPASERPGAVAAAPPAPPASAAAGVPMGQVDRWWLVAGYGGLAAGFVSVFMIPHMRAGLPEELLVIGTIALTLAGGAGVFWGYVRGVLRPDGK